MIAPDMATMPSFIFTDASVEQRTLQSIVSNAANQTFNRVTVDSDTSTSDTVIGAATNRSGDPRPYVNRTPIRRRVQSNMYLNSDSLFAMERSLRSLLKCG